MRIIRKLLIFSSKKVEIEGKIVFLLELVVIVNEM